MKRYETMMQGKPLSDEVIYDCQTRLILSMLCSRGRKEHRKLST